MSKTAKIGLVVLIAVILFGLYFIKNRPEPMTDTTNSNIAVTYEEAVENDLPTMLEFRTKT